LIQLTATSFGIDSVDGLKWLKPIVLKLVINLFLPHYLALEALLLPLAVRLAYHLILLRRKVELRARRLLLF
jgi:hypothetical protein